MALLFTSSDPTRLRLRSWKTVGPTRGCYIPVRSSLIYQVGEKHYTRGYYKVLSVACVLLLLLYDQTQTSMMDNLRCDLFLKY